MKKNLVFGVLLTLEQELKFTEYCRNTNVPDLNYLSFEQRKDLVLKWLKSEEIKRVEQDIENLKILSKNPLFEVTALSQIEIQKELLTELKK